MVEETITWGNLIEVVVLAAGGISVFATMRATVSTINKKVDSIQDEIKKLGQILIDQARFDVTLKNMEHRVTIHDNLIDELRHGHGFVRGQHGIDREYTE